MRSHRWYIQGGITTVPIGKVFALCGVVLTYDRDTWVLHLTLFSYTLSFGRVGAVPRARGVR